MSTDMQFSRRRRERLVVRLPVAVVVETEGAKVRRPAHMLDVSELGLRIKAEATLAPGQDVEVVVSAAEPCRVVWVGQAGSKQDGEAGLEFLHPAPRSEAVP